MADAAVVVPFLGPWESLIPLCDALEAQTARSRLELVLSIDGENTPPESIAIRFDRIVTGPRAGPAEARNRGWRATDSELILFTDGDCVPEPHWAHEMLKALEGDCQAVKGVYSSGGVRLVQRLAQLEFQERYVLMGKAAKLYLADTYSAGFRRGWLKELNGFDNSFPFPEHEDVDLSWRLARAGGVIRFVPSARVAHSHRKTWRGYFRLKFRRGRWRVMLLKRFPERAIRDGYTPQTLKLQMLLSPAVVLSLPFLHLSFAVPAISAGAFLLCTLPLVRVALRHDPALAPIVPVFAFWRAMALLSGSVTGILSERHPCSPR
jgi:GT2 family glycosyltransferase